MKIKNIIAREILDSRGNPTLHASVLLEDGSLGEASVPSGASVGKFEAHELRDADESRYGGLGVLSAVNAVNEIIRPAIIGKDAMLQDEIDGLMIELDGTKNKSTLGANSTLAVSLAVARSAAACRKIPLFRYLGGISAHRMPTPMLNILNGGAHASNNVDIQEFMIVPSGATSFSEKMRIASEIYKKLGSILRSRGYSTAVGDEGGYAPNLGSDEEACELIRSAIESAGYSTGDVKIALDVASSGWFDGSGYKMQKSGRTYTAEELADYYSRLLESYPIVSIEDGLGEEDFDAWQTMTKKLGDKTMLVGDDLFVTNEERLRYGIERGIANAILIKPNQIGTLSETVRVIALAQSNGYAPIISHRSGETEDTFIADLAVATAAPFIKSGAPCRSERVAKYNRLMMIEKDFGMV